MSDNGVTGRVYAKERGGQSWKLEALETHARWAEESGEKATEKAKELSAARKTLRADAQELNKKISHVNEVMREANDKLNAADFGLATVAALATIASVAAAIAGAPVIAAGAGIAIVVVGVGGMITDAHRPEEGESSAESVKKGGEKVEVAGHAAQSSLELAEHAPLKPLAEGAKEALHGLTIAKGPVATGLSKAIGPASGILATIDRYSASQTEAFQLPDIDANNSLSKFEFDLNQLPERSDLSEEDRDEIRKLIRETREAQAKERKARAEYLQARRQAAFDNATYIEFLGGMH